MALVGKDGKVTIGVDTVVGMGRWSIDGIKTDELDSSAFGDNWKSFAYGMKDGGTISFSGHFEPTDVTGQIALQVANLYNSNLTNLRLYLNNTSYFVPCQHIGYFSPNLTTGAPTQLSSVVITSIAINMDKSGLGAVTFTGRVSGCMVMISPPLPPTNVVASVSGSDIVLTWSAVSNVDGYNVYRRLDAGFWVKINSSTVTDLTYTFTPTVPGEYVFGVTSLVGVVEADPSTAEIMTVSSLWENVIWENVIWFWWN